MKQLRARKRRGEGIKGEGRGKDIPGENYFSEDFFLESSRV